MHGGGTSYSLALQQGEKDKKKWVERESTLAERYGRSIVPERRGGGIVQCLHGGKQGAEGPVCAGGTCWCERGISFLKKALEDLLFEWKGA